MEEAMISSLIAAVYKREPLWNQSNQHHKNSYILKELWEEVVQELNMDEKTVRCKWKNLRAYFCQEVQKLEKRKLKSEGGENDCSPWKYFEQMMFLKHKVSQSPKDTHIKIESNTFNGSEVAESSGLESIYLEERAWSSSEESSTMKARKPKRRAKRTHNDHDELLQLKKREIDLLEKASLQEKDDDLLFFKSLLPYMKQIPLIKKLKLRSVMQEAILEQLPA